MKKIFFLVAPVLLLAGCYQKTVDLQQPLQQLSQAVQQINSKVDALSERVTKIEKNGIETVATTTASTADWQTYTNTNLKFSIKVPAGWVMSSAFDGKEFPIPAGNDNEGVPTFTPKGDPSRALMIIEDGGTSCTDPLKPNVSEPYVIDGITFKRSDEPYDQLCFVGAVKPGIYRLINASKKIETTLLDQILGTLKFLP